MDDSSFVLGTGWQTVFTIIIKWLKEHNVDQNTVLTSNVSLDNESQLVNDVIFPHFGFVTRALSKRCGPVNTISFIKSLNADCRVGKQ